MAFELTRESPQAFIAASQIPPYTVVALDSTQGQVVPVTNASQRPAGVVKASAGVGAAVTVFQDDNIVKCIAQASIGFGAEVAFGSQGVSSQVQGGSTLATTTLLKLASSVMASGVPRWAVGVSETTALAGEVFSVNLKARQLGDNL